MLTPETIQGGRGAVPHCGCETPLLRLVPPPWFPNWPLRIQGIMVWGFGPAGYEFAGHLWSERRGTALDRNQNVGMETPRLGPRLPPCSTIAAAAASQEVFMTREPVKRRLGRVARNQHIEARSPQGFRRGVPLHPHFGEGSRWSPLLTKCGRQGNCEP